MVRFHIEVWERSGGDERPPQTFTEAYYEVRGPSNSRQGIADREVRKAIRERPESVGFDVSSKTNGPPVGDPFDPQSAGGAPALPGPPGKSCYGFATFPSQTAVGFGTSTSARIRALITVWSVSNLKLRSTSICTSVRRTRVTSAVS